jgi:hypothetical protein
VGRSCSPCWGRLIGLRKTFSNPPPSLNIPNGLRVDTRLGINQRLGPGPRKFLHKALDIEGKESEGGKELFALLGEVDRALLRGFKKSAAVQKQNTGREQL